MTKTTMVIRESDPTSMRTDMRAVITAMPLVDLLQHAGVSYDAAHELMRLTNGSLEEMLMMSTRELTALPGIGFKRAAALSAILEIGRRMRMVESKERRAMRGPKDVFAHMMPIIGHLEVEEFHVILLDAQHRVIKTVMMTRGLLNSSLVHPRETFRAAIRDGAAAVVLAHNHPSGDPTPSAEDRSVTEQLIAAGRLLDIPVHDHIVIGAGRYVSFAEAGLM